MHQYKGMHSINLKARRRSWDWIATCNVHFHEAAKRVVLQNFIIRTAVRFDLSDSSPRHERWAPYVKNSDPPNRFATRHLFFQKTHRAADMAPPTKKCCIHQLKTITQRHNMVSILFFNADFDYAIGGSIFLQPTEVSVVTWAASIFAVFKHIILCPCRGRCSSPYSAIQSNQRLLLLIRGWRIMFLSHESTPNTPLRRR